MNNKDLVKRKKEIMKNVWVEDRHHDLQKLPKEDAVQIVESMTKTEIYMNVNMRRMQGDYIADYLDYLWEISKPAFWKHINTSIDLKEGILWGGDLNYIRIMCSEVIPKEVLISVIKFITFYKKDFIQDFEIIGCVVKAQVEKFGRLPEINDIITGFDNPNQLIAHAQVNEMVARECSYSV